MAGFGSVIVAVSGALTNVSLGRTVYIWIAASSGAHVQGGFEADASSGNTVTLGSKWKWGGPADANGNAELLFNK